MKFRNKIYPAFLFPFSIFQQNFSKTRLAAANSRIICCCQTSGNSNFTNICYWQTSGPDLIRFFAVGLKKYSRDVVKSTGKIRHPGQTEQMRCLIWACVFPYMRLSLFFYLTPLK